MSRNGTRLKVLITIFVAASTANGETVQSTPSAVAVCQKIADRYRSLANAHPGEPPLIVLATTPATGVTIDHSPETLISSTEDLEAWGAKQDPPVVMDEVIKEVESLDQQAGGLYRIPASNYYSFSNVGSISGCIVAIYFTVSKGRAAPAAGPPRFAMVAAT